MYDASTPLLSRGRLTAEQIDAAFRARNAAAPPLGASFIAEGTATGVNSDLLAIQCGLESAWWGSRYARERNNPSGYGAVDNNPDLAMRFDTPQQGIHVTACHWLTYIMGDGNPFKGEDPRYDALMSTGRAGTVTQIKQLGNGNWASDPDYSAKIIALLNQLSPDGPANGAQSAVNGGTVERPNIISNHTHVNVWNDGDWPGRDAMPVRALVLHVMAGGYQGSIGWFHNPAASASANYCISYEGEITETVDPDTQAPWANGIMDAGATALPGGLADLRRGSPNANWVTVSIETEGHSPFEDNYPTAAEYEAVVSLMAYLSDKYGLTPSENSIVRHTAFDTRNRPNCPGPHWDFAKLITDVTAAMGGSMTDYRRFDETSHGVGGGFRQYWEQHGAIPVFGLPLTEERDEVCTDGVKRTVQYFERARFEYHPETTVGNQVLLTRYGAMDLKAKGESGPGID